MGCVGLGWTLGLIITAWARLKLPFMLFAVPWLWLTGPAVLAAIGWALGFLMTWAWLASGDPGYSVDMLVTAGIGVILPLLCCAGVRGSLAMLPRVFSIETEQVAGEETARIFPKVEDVL